MTRKPRGLEWIERLPDVELRDLGYYQLSDLEQMCEDLKSAFKSTNREWRIARRRILRDVGIMWTAEEIHKAQETPKVAK